MNTFCGLLISYLISIPTVYRALRLLKSCVFSVQKSAWDRDPIADPGAVPPPSERHKQQYAAYEEEKRTAYRLQDINAYLDEVHTYSQCLVCLNAVMIRVGHIYFLSYSYQSLFWCCIQLWVRRI